jgi:hypothetical protein
VRLKNIVGVSALALVISASAVGPAFAQTPVAQTTVAGSPDDQANDDPKAAEEQPKPEQPKPEQPKAEQPKAEQPKPEQPKPEQPKAETPAVDAPAQPPADAAKPKPQKPKATEPKPAADKAKADTPKPAEPKPKLTEPKPKHEKPKPTDPRPKPDKPKPIADDPGPPPHGHDSPSSSTQAPGPGTATEAARGQTVSPAGRAGYSVDVSRARHVSITPPRRGQPTTALADRDGAAGAAPSDPAPLGTAGLPVDATSAIGRQAHRATIHAARLGPANAAAAAVPGERRQTRMLPLDPGPPGYDLTLLLAVVFTAGIAFFIGHQTRRRPRVGARR